MVGNEDILTGYRVGFTDNWLCFKSLFMYHNESGNVWSHMLGALLFVWFGIHLFLFLDQPKVEMGTCPILVT